MTNNNNQDVCVCGWCGTDITDGMEFCSDTCRDRCVDAYKEDMALQQEMYDAERYDLINHDREEYVRNCTDMEMPTATCNRCNTEENAYHLHDGLCDACFLRQEEWS